jgi:hypothetical protein
VSWFISNLQVGIVTRTTRLEALQLRAILTLPNRLTRAADGTIEPRGRNSWISKNRWN